MQRTNWQKLYTLLLLVFICFGLCAQKTGVPQKLKEMSVDMPDETEETDLVDKGQWQLETALLHNRFEDRRHALIGQVLLRYGLSEKLELRLITENGKQRNRYIDETVQSTYPLALGGKVPLLKDKVGLPDISLVAYVQLPFTSRGEQPNIYWSPILLAAFQNKFGAKWKLEYNGGVQQAAYNTTWSEVVNASLHYKLLEPLEIFAEYYAQYHFGEEPQNNIGGGIAYQINNQFEIYVSGGSTLDYKEPNHFFSGGIAYRCGHHKLENKRLSVTH